MENGSNSPPAPGSRNYAWLLVVPFVLLCWPLICCCCLALGAAGFFVEPAHRDAGPLPGLEKVPLLDPDAVPLFGSASLESGFSPDPTRVDARAGGSVDTSGFDPACGTTSFHPAFVLDWQADETGTFLRLFFTPDREIETTLLVLTPDGDWLCEQGSSASAAPVLDLPSAPSGEYAIWIGTTQSGETAAGSLAITQSMDVTP